MVNWEADTIISKGYITAIATLTDRISRFALLRKVEQRKTKLVADAVIELLQPIVNLFHAIITGNGKEFAKRVHNPQKLGMDFFFAHP